MVEFIMISSRNVKCTKCAKAGRDLLELPRLAILLNDFGFSTIVNQMQNKPSVHNIGHIKVDAAGRQIANKDREVGVAGNFEGCGTGAIGNGFYESIASIVIDQTNLNIGRSRSPVCIYGHFLALGQILRVKSISLSARKVAGSIRYRFCRP